MRISTTFFLLALAVIITAGCTTRGSRFDRHSRFGPLKQNCTANQGAPDCGCNTCQSHQPITEQYAATMPAQEFAGHQSMVTTTSGSESLVARLNRLNGNAYGLQNSRSITTEIQTSVADQVVISDSESFASTEAARRPRRTSPNYRINEVVKFDNLRLPVSPKRQSDSSSRMVEAQVESSLDVELESREPTVIVDSAHFEIKLAENRTSQSRSEETSHAESHLNIAPLAQGLTEEVLRAEEPVAVVPPQIQIAEHPEPNLDHIENINLISEQSAHAPERSSTRNLAPQVAPIVSSAYTKPDDSILIVAQQEVAHSPLLVATSDSTPEIHVKSEDAKSLRPTLELELAELEPMELSPIVSAEPAPAVHRQAAEEKTTELAVVPVDDVFAPARSDNRSIMNDNEESPTRGLAKVQKPIVLRATVNQRSNFIDTITQRGRVGQSDRPQFSQRITLPNTAIEMKMNSINFRPLPSQNEHVLPAIDSSAKIHFRSLPIGDGLSIASQVAEPDKSMIVATSKLAVVDERQSQVENSIPTSRIQARTQSAAPVQENVMGILDNNARRLTAPTSTFKPPMHQASIKKRIFESQPEAISAANHPLTNSAASSTADLLRSESGNANMTPGQSNGILRLRARTGQPNGHSLPPIININTTDSPIRIRARDGKPSAPFNQFNIVPGAFDSGKLPSTKNAPMLDDPVVDESIRRLSVRPENSNHTNLKTIER